MPPKRREYGSGSLHQRKDGIWVGTVEAGWTADGTRRRPTVSSKDYDTAKTKLRDLRRRLELEGDSGADTRATVKSWSETWLALVVRDLAPKAYATNASSIKQWVIPTIGHKRLEQLTPADVRAVADAQRAAGRAGSTQLRTHSVLMTMLKAAMREGITVPSRVLLVKPPTKSSSDRADMSVPDATAVLQEAAKLPHGSRYVAALLQGMRQGEALGLTWPQVNLDARTLEISWQLQALPYRVKYDRTSGFRVPDGYEARQLLGAMHLVRPKSQAGWRVIPLVGWMHAALSRWQEIAPPSPHGLVWPSLDGSPRISKDDDAEWYALQGAAEVRHPEGRLYTIHEARHTTATLLLEAGVDPAIIIAIMGHSTILTTRGYQHIRTGPALQALDMVADRLQLAPPPSAG